MAAAKAPVKTKVPPKAPKAKVAKAVSLARPANTNPADAVVKSGNPNIPAVSPTKEKIARTASLINKSANGMTRLQRAVDTLDYELDIPTLNLMMQDPQLNSSVHLCAMAMLSRGVKIKPKINDTKDPNYAKSQLYAEFMQHNLDCMEGSIEEVVSDMAVSALTFGANIAEQTYRYDVGGKFDAKLVLKNIKPKRPDLYGFVVDRAGNVIGIAGYTGQQAENGTIPNVVGETNVDLTKTTLGAGWELIPIEKFAVFTFRKRFSDPRGQSALRPAYGAWFILQQIWPEYLKYLVQFASPSIVGTTPEKAFATRNQDTGQWQDPVDDLFEQLEQWANGGILALRFGSSVDLKFSLGDGTAFIGAISALNRQMVKAVLHQVLATEESKNMARAASTTHQDVLNIGIRALKATAVAMIEEHIFKPLIRYNFGDVAANSLCPEASLGDVEPEDRAAMVQGLAAAGYVFGPEQAPEIDASLEMTVRTPAQAKADFDAKNAPAQTGAFGKPASGTKPKAKTTPKPSPKATAEVEKHLAEVTRLLMAVKAVEGYSSDENEDGEERGVDAA